MPRCTSAGRSSSIRFPGRDPDAAATRGPARGALWHPAALPLPPLGASRPRAAPPELGGGSGLCVRQPPRPGHSPGAWRSRRAARVARGLLVAQARPDASALGDDARRRLGGGPGCWRPRPTTPWSTASAPSTSVTFCWTPSPGRPSPVRRGRAGGGQLPTLRPAQLAQPWRRRADRPRRAGRRPPPEEARGRRRGRGRHGSDGLARRGQRRARRRA